jgi:hypothetical protein
MFVALENSLAPCRNYLGESSLVTSPSDLPRRYRSLMDWENPPFTFAMFGPVFTLSLAHLLSVLFVYFTLYLDAEYALCVPLFLVVRTSLPSSRLAQ